MEGGGGPKRRVPLRILLTCKTPVSVGCIWRNRSSTGGRRPRPGVPRPPDLAGSAFVPPPPRPPGRHRPRPRGGPPPPAPRPSCGRPLPAAPAAFRGSLLSSVSLASEPGAARRGWGAGLRGPARPSRRPGLQTATGRRAQEGPAGEPPAPLGGAVSAGVRGAAW